jgi:PAS domain S-box-containing protein
MDRAPDFWQVFRRSLVPMFVLDDDAVYIDVNDAACGAVGLSREDFVGRRLGFGTDRARQADVARMWGQFLRAGHLVAPYQYRTGAGATVRMNIVCTAHVPEPGHHFSMYWKAPERTNGTLSPRENEIVVLLAAGLSGEQIARRLHLSPETVRTHIRNAMGRLSARTRAHLITKAMEAGIVSPQAVAEVVGAA